MQELREQIHCDVIPIRSSRLEKALMTQDDQGIVKELKELEDLFLTRSDPYTESKPIKDATWFYGRDDLMERISPILAQGQHLGIFGLRKVGKTSLLNQIQQRFLKTPTVLLDCQAIAATADAYFEEIFKQINTELRAHKIKGAPEFKPIANI